MVSLPMLSVSHIHLERCDAALRARIYVIIQTIYMSSAVTNFVGIAEARDSPSWFGLKQHLPLFDSPHQTMTCTRFSSVQRETTNNCNNGAFKNERSPAIIQALSHLPSVSCFECLSMTR